MGAGLESDRGANTADDHESETPARSGRTWRSWPTARGWRDLLVIAGLSCVVVVPIVIATWNLVHPGWVPLSDIAQIELRVRDVGSDHLPLTGPVGRLEGFGETGSHPGPLMFYLLAPTYRLLGGDGNALLLSSVLVSLLAAPLAIWVARRRGGWHLAIAVAVVLALLLRNYGAWRLAVPWNPYVPLVWWFLFLLAIWSVLCHDLWMLPLAVVAGAVCAQSHIAYLGVVIGLSALVAAHVVVTSLWRSRNDSYRRRRTLFASGAAAGVLVLLWLPPLIEQVRHTPGNLSILVESFRHPWDARPTLGTAVSFWGERLDVRQLFTSTLDTSGIDPAGSSIVGYAFLGLWGVAAGLSLWRRRDPALLRLHATVAAALAVGLLALGRIVGPMWTYLGLWMWGVCALMLLAVVWTLLTLANPQAPDRTSGTPYVVAPPARPGPSAVFLACAAVAIGVLFSIDGARSRMPNEGESAQLRELVEHTVTELQTDPAGCGGDCRYLVSWADPYGVGAQGFGMLAELERLGFDARASADLGLDHIEAGLGSHRLIRGVDADAELHLALGPDAMDRARLRPGASELAYVDPNTPEERAEYLRERRRVVAGLRAEGYDDEAAEAEEEPYSLVPIDAGMSEDLSVRCSFHNSHDRPGAVFVIVAPS